MAADRLRSVTSLACLLIVSACAAAPDPAPEPVVVPAPAPVAANDAIGDLIAEIPPPEAPTIKPAEIPAEPAAPEPAASAVPPRGSLGEYLAGLRSTSCPTPTRRVEPQSVQLSVSSVPLQGFNPGRKTVGELAYAGGFNLTSADERFGGLSGIAVLENGNLLAVSDQGDMVWIDLAADGVTPTAARIAPLRDAGGEGMRGKSDGDAEGLAVNDGLALVSFERNHRVLAYDIANCGAAARGAPLVHGGFGRALPDAFREAKIDVGENSGPEPLAVTPDWYLFTGLETKAGDASPLSARPIEAPAQFGLRLGAGVPEFVGLDIVPTGDKGQDVRAFSLHRAFNPLSGNAIAIVETRFERWQDQSNLPALVVSEVNERSHYRFRARESRRLAQLNLLFTIDNFEGLAAKLMPDGGVRLYMISDNNFSGSQRTLLFVFDLPA